MKAGFGRVEITPPLGVELTGYGYYLQRRAERVDDPLYARCLLLDDGQTRALILCCDLLGLNRQIAAQVRAAAEAELNVPAEHCLIVCIHTHTGPSMIYHEGCGEVEPAVRDAMADRLIAACRAASEDLKPVTGLRSGERPAEGDYAYNRAKPGAYVDPNVRGMELTREGGRPIAVVSYACHPVVRGRSTGISADYPGRLVAKLGDMGYEGLFLNGLCGDIDPTPLREGETVDSRLDDMTDALIAAYKLGLQADEPVLRAKSIPCTLGLQHVTRATVRAAADNEAHQPGADTDGRAKVARIWEREQLEKADYPDDEGFSAACVELGQTILVALPFEGFTEIGRLTRMLYRGSERLWVLGCADELLGYLPTRDEMQRGTYAALESMFHYKRLPPRVGEAERLGAELADTLRF